ncbi:hypothetical protein BG004_001288, partial [Podila humilis]
GADLCHIVCDEAAATAIKSYSPDLIVHPLIRARAIEQLQEECDIENKNNNNNNNNNSRRRIDTMRQKTKDDFSAILERVHVLVIGPGLSRDPTMQIVAREAIIKARSLFMPVVIDADGLFLIQNEPDLIHGYSRAILTPNVAEFSRLCKVKNVDPENKPGEKPAAKQLSNAFGGVIVVEKGKYDIISNGDTVHVVSIEGGLKRSGGQGDLLSGMIATSLAWIVTGSNKNQQPGSTTSSTNSANKNEDDCAMRAKFLVACFGASTFVRQCSRRAWSKHGRAVQSSDILAEIGPMFAKHVEHAAPTATWQEACGGPSD